MCETTPRYLCLVWGPRYRKNISEVEWVQHRITKTDGSPKRRAEALRREAGELDLFSLGKDGFSGGISLQLPMPVDWLLRSWSQALPNCARWKDKRQRNLKEVNPGCWTGDLPWSLPIWIIVLCPYEETFAWKPLHHQDCWACLHFCNLVVTM